MAIPELSPSQSASSASRGFLAASLRTRGLHRTASLVLQNLAEHVARPQTAAEGQNVSAGGSPRGVEWLCVGECLRFSLRHYRYFLIFLVLYWRSVWHWRRTRAARYGFCFLQLYDDIMDGDRVTAAAPDDIAAQTIAEWESGQFRGDTSLSRLGAALKDAL